MVAGAGERRSGWLVLNGCSVTWMMKSSGDGRWGWFHSVKILKSFELNSFFFNLKKCFKWLSLCYIYFTTIKTGKKWMAQFGVVFELVHCWYNKKTSNLVSHEHYEKAK